MGNLPIVVRPCVDVSDAFSSTTSKEQNGGSVSVSRSGLLPAHSVQPGVLNLMRNIPESVNQVA